MYRAVSSFCRIDLPLNVALPLLHGAEPAVIEVFCEAPHLDPAGDWRQTVRDLHAYGRDHAIQYALHAPCFDLNPAAANAGERQEVLRQYRWAIDCAVELGAAPVVLHSGQRSDPRLDAATARGYTRAMLETLVPYAAAAGVRLALENTGYGNVSIISQPADLTHLITGLSETVVGITLDLGHLHLQQIDVTAALAAWLPRLWNIHLHDNRTSDDHLPPGQGSVPIAVALAALQQGGYSGPVVLEAFLGGAQPMSAEAVWHELLLALVRPVA